MYYLSVWTIKVVEGVTINVALLMCYVDYVQVYWTETSPPCIKRANFNGSQVEVFINSSIARPEGIAVDPYAGNLYWMDARLNTLVILLVACWFTVVRK